MDPAPKPRQTAAESRSPEEPVAERNRPARERIGTTHGAAADPRAGGQVKGTLLISRMKFLRARGPTPVHAVLERLSRADQEVLEGILLPSSWYPHDLLLRLETALTAVIARGDRARVFAEMGRFSADANLGPGGVQRPYLREGDPHHLLERVPRMYLSQHTTGRRSYERTGERAAVIRTHEADTALAEDCLMVVGWIERAIEICGGVGVHVIETRCRARGEDVCEYRCAWA